MTRYRLVMLHGLIVVIFTALTLPILFPQEGQGVDIGAAFFAMLLGVLALPLSLLWIAAVERSTSSSMRVHTILFIIVLPVAAFVNVFIHYRLRRYHLRASGPPSPNPRA